MNLYSFFMGHFREKMWECKNALVLKCFTATPRPPPPPPFFATNYSKNSMKIPRCKFKFKCLLVILTNNVKKKSFKTYILMFIVRNNKDNTA